jgi:hypothetical protein
MFFYTIALSCYSDLFPIAMHISIYVRITWLYTVLENCTFYGEQCYNRGVLPPAISPETMHGSWCCMCCCYLSWCEVNSIVFTMVGLPCSYTLEFSLKWNLFSANMYSILAGTDPELFCFRAVLFLIEYSSLMNHTFHIFFTFWWERCFLSPFL